MKKSVLNFIILLLVCVMLASCAGSATTENSTEITTAGETEPEVTEPVRLDVASDGKCNFKVIRADDENNTAIFKLATAFKDELGRRVGAAVDIGNDFVYDKDPLDPAAPEILVGDTNREESAKLKDELKKAGGSRFGIYASEHKIAVCGTSEYLTYLALSYFMDNFIDGKGGKPSLSVEAGTLYVSDEQEESVPDFEEARKQGKSLAFYSAALVTGLKTANGFSVLQGGGCDGKYAYYVMINKQTNEGIIFKYDLNTWKGVKKSKALPTGHSNDIAYDAVNNKLVLSYCLADDSYTGVCVVDADTLEFETYTQTKFAQRAVEYLPETDQYLFGTNYFYTLTDNKFNQISRFDDMSPNYTTQGMCCDSKYVYDVRWESSETLQHIIVHDYHSGKGYGEIPFYGATGEPENIFRLGDVFYVACNKSLKVQRLVLLPETFW